MVHLWGSTSRSRPKDCRGSLLFRTWKRVLPLTNTEQKRCDRWRRLCWRCVDVEVVQGQIYEFPACDVVRWSGACGCQQYKLAQYLALACIAGGPITHEGGDLCENWASLFVCVCWSQLCTFWSCDQWRRCMTAWWMTCAKTRSQVVVVLIDTWLVLKNPSQVEVSLVVWQVCLQSRHGKDKMSGARVPLQLLPREVHDWDHYYCRRSGWQDWLREGSGFMMCADLHEHVLARTYMNTYRHR